MRTDVMANNQALTELGDILVVDDEASVVEVVSLYLQREGFQVRVAGDGRSALIAIREKAAGVGGAGSDAAGN
ncbi:MAG: hypothetical protein M5U34_00460 [Chloroflexi bacterium]|nr:hypothetical protein [Chloroflexota bacterium]